MRKTTSLTGQILFALALATILGAGITLIVTRYDAAGVEEVEDFWSVDQEGQGCDPGTPGCQGSDDGDDGDDCDPGTPGCSAGDGGGDGDCDPGMPGCSSGDGDGDDDGGGDGDCDPGMPGCSAGGSGSGGNGGGGDDDGCDPGTPGCGDNQGNDGNGRNEDSGNIDRNEGGDNPGGNSGGGESQGQTSGGDEGNDDQSETSPPADTIHSAAPSAPAPQPARNTFIPYIISPTDSTPRVPTVGPPPSKEQELVTPLSLFKDIFMDDAKVSAPQVYEVFPETTVPEESPSQPILMYEEPSETIPETTEPEMIDVPASEVTPGEEMIVVEDLEEEGYIPADGSDFLGLDAILKNFTPIVSQSEDTAAINEETETLVEAEYHTSAIALDTTGLIQKVSEGLTKLGDDEPEAPTSRPATQILLRTYEWVRNWYK